MNRRSIRFRLTAWYAAILAATFTIGAVGVWLAIRDSIYDTVDRELRVRLARMHEFLQHDAAYGGMSADELAEDAALAPAGTRFRLADSTGAWRYQSPGTPQWGPAPPDIPNLPKRGKVETVSEKGRPVRVLSAFTPEGLIQIGIPLDEFDEMLHAFAWTALLGSPLLLILASAGGYLMSRRALAPVEQISRTATEIEARNLSERLPVRGTDDELDQLSATLNAMLARLQESFRRITQFTADASHELRTPVAIIRTTAEVIRKKPRTEKEYADALDRILAESERTTGLIEDLMFLARADANIEELVLEPVSLSEIAHSASRDATILAEAGGIRLTASVSTACEVSGDAQALRRVVLILLDNAIKYSKPGGEVVLQLAACRQDERPMAHLEVRDNGIGIAAADLPHIFERFYRASKDRSRTISGVGLGLSIAQSIVKRHGGEIRIESEPGQGTTAHVLLPAL